MSKVQALLPSLQLNLTFSHERWIYHYDVKVRLGVLRSHSVRDKSTAVMNVYIFEILL